MIMNARKTLLFHHEEPWMKKNAEEDFDVPMGCHDGAEIYKLVGKFILNKISPIMHEQNNVGLYRDDGLGIFRNLSRPNMERKKKEITKIFESFGLSITVTTNVASANYLENNFDLTKDIYKPYRKPNDEPVYINRHSSHSPNIIRQIPLSVSSRIPNISSNQSIFNSSIPMYKEVLTKSGFNDDIIYTPGIQSNNSERKNTKKRKVIWFNPPYTMNMENQY